MSTFLTSSNTERGHVVGDGELDLEAALYASTVVRARVTVTGVAPAGLALQALGNVLGPLRVGPERAEGAGFNCRVADVMKRLVEELSWEAVLTRPCTFIRVPRRARRTLSVCSSCGERVARARDLGPTIVRTVMARFDVKAQD